MKPPDTAKDEPKGDVVERKPLAMSVEEKTDDEGINSNKTSVESLREANENNSNNGGPRWQRGRCQGRCFRQMMSFYFFLVLVSDLRASSDSPFIHWRFLCVLNRSVLGRPSRCVCVKTVASLRL